MARKDLFGNDITENTPTNPGAKAKKQEQKQENSNKWWTFALVIAIVAILGWGISRVTQGASASETQTAPKTAEASLRDQREEIEANVKELNKRLEDANLKLEQAKKEKEALEKEKAESTKKLKEVYTKISEDIGQAKK